MSGYAGTDLDKWWVYKGCLDWWASPPTGSDARPNFFSSHVEALNYAIDDIAKVRAEREREASKSGSPRPQ